MYNYLSYVIAKRSIEAFYSSLRLFVSFLNFLSFSHDVTPTSATERFHTESRPFSSFQKTSNERKPFHRTVSHRLTSFNYFLDEAFSMICLRLCSYRTESFPYAYLRIKLRLFVLWPSARSFCYLAVKQTCGPYTPVRNKLLRVKRNSIF